MYGFNKIRIASEAYRTRLVERSVARVAPAHVAPDYVYQIVQRES